MYWECPDFYYSGHVGLTTLLLTELYIIKDMNAFWVTVFITVLEAFMLVFVRAHYIIDVVSGFICAKYFFIWAEVVAYYWDVALCGYPAHKRDNYYFKACPRCGWCNHFATSHVDSTEFSFQWDRLLAAAKKTR
jgi:hypothetical protein